ncbi:MAG: hypothetical protein ACRD0A_12070 [Acidimicrobiales bacterium]
MMAGGAELEALSHELERGAETSASLAEVAAQLEQEVEELGIGDADAETES